jgi:autotransporter-associated beta strand protein
LFQLNSAMDKNFVFNGNGVADTLLGEGSTSSSQNTIQPSTGTVTLNGACVFDAAAGFLSVNATMTGSGSLTKIGVGTNFLSGNIGYSGVTTVSAGQLDIDGTKTGGAGITVAATGVLAGYGSTTESVTNNGTIISGDPLNSPAVSLTVGNLTLNSGNVVIDVDAAVDPIIANGAVTLNGVVTLQLVSQSGYSAVTSGQQITVIQYSGALSGGLANLTLAPNPPGYSFALVDPATTPGKIVVSVNHVPQPLTWLGLSPTALTLWQAGGPTNWIDNNGSVLSVFTNGDNVTFDDNGTNLVTLSGSLNPLSITVSSSRVYTFTGSGGITGPGLLSVYSPLIIANSGTNDFSGGTVINGGEVVVGTGGTNGSIGTGAITNNTALVFNLTNTVTISNRMVGGGVLTNEAGVLTLSGNNSALSGQVVANGGTLRSGSTTGLGSTNSGSILVASNATVDINGQNLGTEPVTVSGSGVSSNGAFINNGASQQNAVQNMTLAGDTTFGGTGRWDIRSSTVGGASLSSSGNPYNLTKTGSNSVWLVNVSFDSAISNITVDSGLLGYQDGTTGLGNPAGTLTVNPGASLGFFNSQNPLNKIISLNGDATNNAVSVLAGTNAISGTVSITGGCIFNLATGTILTLNGGITGGGSLTEIGNGTLAIDSAYSWSGNTTVGSGTLDLSGSGNPTLSLAAGQMLQGDGTIIGSVNSAGGSTVEPGPAIGALSVSGAIVLNGTTIMEVSQATATNTILRSTNSSITYGGSLVVSNLAGSFVGGESYKLFNSGTGSYLNSFASIQLPALSPGLSWNTNQLSVNGTISVTGSIVLTPPTISHAGLSGGNIIISGTNNSGPGGTYHVLSSTNLTVPLTNWSVVTNGTFDASGNFSSTNATGTNARQFYILQVP